MSRDDAHLWYPLGRRSIDGQPGCSAWVSSFIAYDSSGSIGIRFDGDGLVDSWFDGPAQAIEAVESQDPADAETARSVLTTLKRCTAVDLRRIQNAHRDRGLKLLLMADGINEKWFVRGMRRSAIGIREYVDTCPRWLDARTDAVAVLRPFRLKPEALTGHVFLHKLSRRLRTVGDPPGDEWWAGDQTFLIYASETETSRLKQLLRAVFAALGGPRGLEELRLSSAAVRRQQKAREDEASEVARGRAEALAREQQLAENRVVLARVRKYLASPDRPFHVEGRCILATSTGTVVVVDGPTCKSGKWFAEELKRHGVRVLVVFDFLKSLRFRERQDPSLGHAPHFALPSTPPLPWLGTGGRLGITSGNNALDGEFQAIRDAYVTWRGRVLE